MTADHTPSRGCYQRGCRLPECVRESYRYEKHLALDLARGRRRQINATQTRAHAERLVAANWTHGQIAEAAHVARSVIGSLLDGRPKVRSSTALAVLSIPIGPPPVPVVGVDATGSMRRIQALMTIGHNCQTIARHTAVSDDKITRIAAGWFTTVSPQTASAIARAFRALVAAPGTSSRARGHARRNNWHGPLAWDDIDDPNAVPDWTGHCGTDRGWWLHRLEKIPVCPPCQAAHEQWKTEHAHLTQQERWAELGLARAQARTREADLATDGRELMRLGLDYEQTAERLGVTRNHLQQAMLRHPEAMAA
jgi:plasmid maintenance system antidote protein VapI